MAGVCRDFHKRFSFDVRTHALLRASRVHIRPICGWGDRCFVVRRDICVLARSCTDELPHQCILRRLRTLCLVHRRHRTRSAQDSGDSRYPVPCWAAPCGRAQVCIRVPRARTGAAALYMLMWSSGRARTLNTVGCDTACGRRSDARDPNLQHIMRRQSTQ